MPPFDIRRSPFWGALWIHSDNKVVDQPEPSGSVTGTDGVGDFKKMRKKLKGKRAVVKWLKFFRWKKKKEYERMTEEEKILYKMSKVFYLSNRYTE